MDRKYKVKHIYIGNDDVQEWTQGVGKFTLMPLMFRGIKQLVKSKLKKYQVPIISMSQTIKKFLDANIK